MAPQKKAAILVCEFHSHPQGASTVIRNWEATFVNWASPPGQTEQERCDNSVRAVRDSITKYEALKNRRVKVFVQGSYRNRVNARADSDVDIGIVCNEAFYDDYPPGMNRENFGFAPYDYVYLQFKNEVGQALTEHFGANQVTRGNKAFRLRDNSYRVQADVVPLFEYRRYRENGSYLAGVCLFPDKGNRIENYPERLFDYWPNVPLHYENGVQKNTETNRAYKGVVRILKKLRQQMQDDGIEAVAPGYLIECLVYNAPNAQLSADTWCECVEDASGHLWACASDEASCSDWTEVDQIKPLFLTSQTWTRAEAYDFLSAVRRYFDC